MVKLTGRKIRWIIREKEKRVLSAGDIAGLQSVSESGARQIWCAYRRNGIVPSLKNPGRPGRSITRDEVSVVVSMHKEFPCSAIVMEFLLHNFENLYGGLRLRSQKLWFLGSELAVGVGVPKVGVFRFKSCGWGWGCSCAPKSWGFERKIETRNLLLVILLICSPRKRNTNCFSKQTYIQTYIIHGIGIFFLSSIHP